MNHELAHIYRELDSGTLLKEDALTRIRALNLPPDASRSGVAQTKATTDTLLAEPVWEQAAATAGPPPATHLVLLCGLANVDATQMETLLPGSRCTMVEIATSASPANDYATAALAYFEAVRTLLRDKPLGRCVVQLVAVDREDAQLLAGLAGLIETTSLENPDIAGQVLLFPVGIDPDALIGHLRVDAADPEARVLRYTCGRREVRRWRVIDESASRPDALCRFREHGVYLVTGGLGGLGLLVAREVLTTAAHARVVLCGRSALGDEGRSALDALEAPGRVEYRRADIGDAAQTDALIAGILADHGALHGVIHSAGIVRDEFILKKSSVQFAEVLRPKVAGSEHLDLATAALPLDMFVLFSSIAAWIGNIGQADYSAANGFIDQFAGWRNTLVAERKRHGVSLAIAWPHWRDGGMSVDAASLRALEKRTGLRSMGTSEGMRVLHRVLALGRSHVMAMHGVAAEMRRALTSDRAAATTAPAVSAPPLPQAPMPVAASSDLVGKTRDWLRGEFSAVLKIPKHRIEARAPLEQYGIDSILAMSFTTQLEASFGALPKTLFFEYLSIDELAAYFVRAHAPTLASMFTASVSSPPVSGAPTATPASSHASAAAPLAPRAGRGRKRFLAAAGTSDDAMTPATFAHEPVAIVGLSGRYPQSPDLDAFWRNLRDGSDCIVEVPASRWDWKAWYSEDRSVEGAHFSKWGGFIDGVDEFDPRFFNIAPREAHAIDPQERLFLQHAWMAIEDAGFTRASLQLPDAKGLPGQVGVYAGVMYGEYNQSGSLASIANRVSYFLNLHGPSLTLDTMCSSSLTALHLACQDLRLGRTSLALAGGVNVSVHPNKYTMLSGGQFISGDGHCQSFGEGGDGYIPGEGVGVAVLMRLSEAVRGGNHIHGVIRGSALNHGGKTNGYTVPNPRAQADVIRRALGEAGVEPRNVSYIEAHGTGTKLGDPIEIAALTSAFRDESSAQDDDSGYCLIGSAKSNIGHCESAAGIAGVTKVLLQMRHASIVPSLHSKVLNPHIDFASTPFVVVQNLRPWERPMRGGIPMPRIAGVSSFGAGGANAHVVLEEHIPAGRAPARADAVRLLPLSARNAQQLQARANDLLGVLDRDGSAVDMRDLAHTLQVGREAMDQRVCFVVDGMLSMCDALREFLAGNAPVTERMHVGSGRKQRDALSERADDPVFQSQVERATAERSLAALAAMWVEGVEIDWRRISDDVAPRLMSLPAYPFAKERYWTAPATASTPVAAQPVTLHPLVHRNVSDLREHRYLARFDARQAPLDGDTLSPLLALEALRATLALAVPAGDIANAGQSALTRATILRDIAWGESMSAADIGGLAIGISVLSRSPDAIDLEMYRADGAGESVFVQAHAFLAHDVPDIAADSRDIETLRNAMRAQPAPQLDGVVALFAGDDALLAELSLPADGDMWVSQDMARTLSALCEQLEGGVFAPLSLRSARLLTACPAQAFVHLRRADDGALDIAVCDVRGHVCLALGGLIGAGASAGGIVDIQSAAAAPPSIAKSLPRRDAIEPAGGEPSEPQHRLRPREIPLARHAASAAPMMIASGVVRPKPSTIALRPAADIPLDLVAPKGKIRLLPLTAAAATTTTTHDEAQITPDVHLFDLGDGVFSLALDTMSLDDAIDSILVAVEHVRSAIEAHHAKALILDARHPGFWRGGRATHEAAVARGLYAALAQLPVATIAAIPGDADGAGLLLAATCDFMVLAEQSRLRFADVDAAWFASESEAAFLRERFGTCAEPLLAGGGAHDSQSLGLHCHFADAGSVSIEARRIATALVHVSPLALALLKPHLAGRLAPLAAALIPTPVTPAQVSHGASHAADRTLVFTIGGGGVGGDARRLLADIKAVVARAIAADDVASIVIASALEGFLPRLPESEAVDLIVELDALLTTCPVPVIAALGAQADGAAWRFALACDAVVYVRDALYSASTLWVAPALARSTAALCALRLGEDIGRELQFTLGACTGAELAARVPALTVAESGDGSTEAMRLAAFWSHWPREAIVAHISSERARLASAIAALPGDFVAVDVDGEIDLHTTDAARPDIDAVASYRTETVTLTLRGDGVGLIEMHDRAARNMFSSALVEGLKEAFARAVATPGCRALVITGYDNYFATGGTLETLLAIQDGQAQFTDETVFQLPMDCPLPTIAAIQGHAIGGGWSFGMFADLVLLSEESRYLSPYMGYGFTPGAGSTLMLPARLGHDLARETLLVAQELSGHSLARRAVPVPVLPRHDVLPAALALAQHVARQPRARLASLKRLWTRALRDAREDTYAREVAMHAETFVDNADTLRRIQDKFSAQGATVERSLPTPAAVTSSPAQERIARSETTAAPRADANASRSSSTVATVSLASIIDTIRTLLAQELFLQPEEIDPDTPFIDLGLDSITGVTLVRRINAEYGIEIEATRVYSHPTLQALAALVLAASGTEVDATASPPPSIPVAAPVPTGEAASAAGTRTNDDGSRLRDVIARIRTLLAAELHLSTDEIGDATPFIDMGLDSITGVTWVRRINAQFGISIDATKVYSHPTLNDIGILVLHHAELAGTVAPIASRENKADPYPTASPATTVSKRMDAIPTARKLDTWRRFEDATPNEATVVATSADAGHAAVAAPATAPIAVIGIAGQFPQATDVEAYWANLAAGRSCIDEVADRRWSVDAHFRPGAPSAGKTNSKWLGALEDYDCFDPLFFSISPTEAETMDPQQRLFVQACWHAIENAGYAPNSLSASSCGVFVGCGPSDYHQSSQTRRLSAQGFTGAATSILAARISYVLNLRGPCLSIDTACSSSLVAIAAACDSLNASTSDLAIAGGVYVMGGPSMHVMTAQAGMLSADGRCYAFDARANGFVPGEAVGAIVLKRLSDAERDGDRVQAVIEGWGVNQDGRTNGITAPSEDAQAQLLQSVYRRFGIDPEGIQLIEAHGTGTKLGDPIEVAGLKAAFAPFTAHTGFCALGSVKSNIGHCLTAAGAAGVIKLVLALRERQLPPTIHFETLNEHIRLDHSPFYVNDRLQSWQPDAGRRRRAAISSFGFSGTNAHIVLAEHQPSVLSVEPDPLSQNGRLLVPLSARNEAQLHRQAERLCAHLRVQRAAGDDMRLSDVAYTLQVGRDDMAERLCVLVDSIDALIDALDGFLAGRADAAVIFRGQLKRDRESLKLLLHDDDLRETVLGKWLRDRRFDRLAELWAKGLSLDWAALYAGSARPQRVALPGYPFARERYVLGVDGDTSITHGRSNPLLHANVSSLSGQRYRTRLRGDEPVCLRLDGVAMVAPVVLLEMARAAVADATADLFADADTVTQARSSDPPEVRAAIELADISWDMPVATGEGVDLWVDLYTLDDGPHDSTAQRSGAIGLEITSGSGDARMVHFTATAIAYVPVARVQAPHADLDALRARTRPEAFDSEEFRASLPSAGLDIGSALFGLTALRRGDREVLAQLAVPPGEANAGAYGLHPALLQGVLLATMRFLDGDADLPVSPVALSAFDSVAPGGRALTAWIRDAATGRGFDIDLFDVDGAVCVTLQGLRVTESGETRFKPVAHERAGVDVVAARTESRLTYTAPVWETIALVDDPTVVEADGILVIGADVAQRQALEQHHGGTPLRFLAVGPDDDVAGIVGAISTTLADGYFDRLLWIATTTPRTDLTEDSLIDDQQRGILMALRIARALVALGKEASALRWDMVVLHAIPIYRGDATDPAHAGLQGFSGSLSEAYPLWQIRLVDVPALDMAALKGMDCLPSASRNACYAQRGGGWYCQQLVVAEMPAAAEAARPYREGGVYVVVGGAGGIGEAWTRHVVTRYRAQVVWIGRRAEDDALRSRIEAIAAHGPAPIYVQANATDPEQLRAAHALIRGQFPAIHGVVHSAVGAYDQSLKTVSEADFRAILSAKIELSVRIAQIFAAEPLDFALFFSSNASFVRGAGMSGYSAGCTFKDAYALRLSQVWPCPVKVVNWGYWSVGSGEAMTDAMKAYFHASGYRPLDAVEAMRALDDFLVSDFEQISITRSTRTDSGTDGTRMIAHGVTGAPPPLEALQALDFSARFAGVVEKAGAEMQPLLRRLLAAMLGAVGDVTPSYRRWRAESLAIVAAADSDDGLALDAVWNEWDASMSRWKADAGKAALCTFVDTCMRALPDILSGRRKATDVIFPGSSLEFVERVYKTDTISLAYNDSLSETVLAAVRASLERSPQAKIRLLEIGAGTGASTVGILAKLAPYAERIAEYCYTDVSKAFLFHAETHYAQTAPYLRTRLFNVEKPLAEQGMALGSYDLVIAANVIHATSNIRNTIRNTKALLRRGGMLVMNEISDHSICGHVTFGLLDGWWLNEDQALRIPGSPGLYPERWREVLVTEGFPTVLFPCGDAHYAGQQIVAAISDGIARQAADVASLRKLAPDRATRLPTIAATSTASPDPSHHVQSLRQHTMRFCSELIGRALKIDADEIDVTEPLGRYGIDSIIVGLVNQELQKHFDDVGSTLLYEHQTIEGVADHLIESQHRRLQALFPASERTALPGPRIASTALPSAARQTLRPSANVPERNDASLLEETMRFCKDLVGRALKIDADEIDATEPLERYGIDSIIVTLVNQELQNHFEDVGSTLLYEHQTVDGIARHLLDTQRTRLEALFFQAAEHTAAPARTTTREEFVQGQRGTSHVGRRGRARGAPFMQPQQTTSKRQPIAVIGLSGMYPHAHDLQAFWENFKQGRDCIGEIPAVRWSLDGFFEPDEKTAVEEAKSYCKWGGFLERFAEFDSLFFGIPPREAFNMDPQERLFLQGAWNALENAGYTRRAMRDGLRRRVGVFAGITRAGYNLYRNTGDSAEKFWPRTSFASVANRLSYLLDVQGPSLPIDTMCSSSLTAIHEACEHIRNGDCDMAIAGGVNLYLHPTSFVDMSSQHMLSSDGACKSFGEGANGFVPGEGVGVAILKSLDRAEADGDIIHGLILSTHINHGGKTSGFTVPNPVAQADLVRTALDKAGISARAVSYIEAHGTGTELGDPIEIAGLQQAFGPDSTDTGYCRIGSAKSNIGHLEAAAGIAGLTKVLLQLRHGQIAPTLHCNPPNPHIRFDRTAFTLNRELVPWERPVVDGRTMPRIAGISSFGAGGANAHVIVQEYRAAASRMHAYARPADEPALVPLSAMTSAQLRQKVTDLREALSADGGCFDLDAVAYTLQIGRESMEERVLFVADSILDLIARLDGYVLGEAPNDRAYRGQAQRRGNGAGSGAASAEAVDEALRERQLSELARSWTAGAEVDWQRLYECAAPPRVELPTYPFARDEYWLDSVAPAAVHPPAIARGTVSTTRRDFTLIEDILNRVEASALDAEQGARLLKKLV